MARCSCYSDVIHHIPIADLADIVHEYMKVAPRVDKNHITIPDGGCMFDIWFETDTFRYISISYTTPLRGKRYTVWHNNGYSFLNQFSHMCASIFQWPDMFSQCIDYSEIKQSSSSRSCCKKQKRKVRACINAAHRILSAEETNGHAHPDEL